MNVERGYNRLSIAVVGAWIATWGSIAAFAIWQHDGWSGGLSEALESGSSPALIEMHTARVTEYAELAAFAIKWGLLAIPISLLFTLGWWVYRGFVPYD